MTELDVLAGRLILEPGTLQPVRCERPMVGVAMMRRLTEGRRAALLPELIGNVFSLCASAQRQTSRRAVAAALGMPEDAEGLALDRLALRLNTAREHLQRLALDLPQRVPLTESDSAWLRGAPVLGLPARMDATAAVALRQAAASMPAWLARQLLGMPPAEWLAAWHAGPGPWLSEWAAQSARRGHPLGRWLQAAEPMARSLSLPCRPLGVLGEFSPPAPTGGPVTGLSDLARGLADDEGFAERPTWDGAPAETGPWTRGVGRDAGVAAGAPLSLWHRLGSRIAELAWLADGGELALGTLRLARGEALAYSEMSRGLLIHWIRLDDGPSQPDTARAERYRVLAPTEWNFHPEGALAQALRTAGWSATEATLGAAALDPCVAFEVRGPGADTEAGDA